ncbi:hypothetical protein [Calothrix sp. 336/3]|uniref:hypothetical protein n=1 Tax=Calothrix sp. 336/3 TaxID=1337936 RepID=UPI0004E3B2E0|nr:hypothetical protein [Calothrix sp. 336/3]AKG23628.1 hypothetical protein IJ00_22150 [Calothrix sp. 336/3]
MLMKVLRQFTVVVLALSLCLTTVACGGNSEKNQPQASNTSQATNSPSTKLSDGQYPVQQASYNDGDGEYTLFLLNSTPPTYKTEKLQMARLSDAEIKEGKKAYLKVESGQPVLYLTEDFKIEYVHNVTETKNNPQTGQKEVVVVRQENSFWAPFAGAIAGQAIGSLLFTPHYYFPPVYQPGGVLNGYGGYGRTYDVAVNDYRQRYNQPPAAVRNRTAFRTTSNLRRSNPGNNSAVRNTPNNANNRPTGSGFGSNTLRQSGKTTTTRRSPSGFGSGRSVSRPSFGRRR